MRIDAQVIEHTQQRYNTVGDWWFDEQGQGEPVLRVRVSRMTDWRYEVCCAMHETLEAILCHARGISEKRVTEFDLQFESAYERNPNLFSKHVAEPGDVPSAPYYTEHQFAMGIERLIAQQLDVVWYLYDQDMDALYRPEKE